MNVKTEICKSVASLLREVAKIPEDIEIENIENETLKETTKGLLRGISEEIDEAKDYVIRYLNYINEENDNVETFRTSEYDTEINKELGILGGV